MLPARPPPPPPHRPGAPQAESPTRESAPRPAEGHGGRRGVARLRAARPRRGRAGGREAARGAPGGPGGAPGTYHGRGNYLINTDIEGKGARGGIRPRRRTARMRAAAGKGGEARAGGAPPCSVPLPARRGQGRPRAFGGPGWPP